MHEAANSGALDSGFSDPRRRVLSDLSVDLSFMSTSHADQTYGGRLSYTAGRIGVRVGGNRRIRPRPFICGGWGWYSFDFDSLQRSDAFVSGPWCGAGAEFFVTKGFAVALDGRAHFSFGEDDDGRLLDGGLAYGNVSVSFYW